MPAIHGEQKRRGRGDKIFLPLLTKEILSREQKRRPCYIGKERYLMLKRFNPFLWYNPLRNDVISFNCVSIFT
jgi:hypothetical protein